MSYTYKLYPLYFFPQHYIIIANLCGVITDLRQYNSYTYQITRPQFEARVVIKSGQHR